MIEKMRKVSFLVTDREYEGFVGSLQELGVVHVEQLQQGATSPQLQSALDLERRYRAAIAAVKAAKAAYVSAGAEVATDSDTSSATVTPESLLLEVEELQQKESRLVRQTEERRKMLQQLRPWGDFCLDAVARLEEASGLRMFFFRCPAKTFSAEWADAYFATIVSEVDGRAYFIAFATEQPVIAAEAIQLPAESLSEVEASLASAEAELGGVRQRLVQIAACADVLEKGRLDALNSVQLSRVHLSGELVAGDQLHLLMGWVRADREEALVRYLDEAHIYYDLGDPVYEDDVPVEITNGSFSRLFEPILKMYSLPSYQDIDPTFYFAPFFMLFFGLCLGDGGYGLVVLLVGLLLTLKGGDSMRSYGKLALWLGGATLVCGLAMGTFFGIDLAKQEWAFLAPVRQYFISDSGIGTIWGYSPMMVLSIIIGLVQVLLGMMLKGCKAWFNYGLRYAVSTFAWVVIIVACIVLFGLPLGGFVLASWLTFVLYALIALSALCVLLYNNPAAYKKPALAPFLNLGSGLWATYNMATGLLGDLLSYIRLFALGLTGGILGGVFNLLALDLTSGLDWYVRWLPMLIILLLGHGITFALSLISAFVHPMRLTFVEFFKNADFSGGGRPFDPFRVQK